MKTTTLLILGMIFSFNISQAQGGPIASNISNETNESTSVGEVRYYYYPNLQAYFDTKVAMYLYMENGKLIVAEQIPSNLRGYSLKNGQYVMLKDYNGDDPYDLINEHKAQYPADYSSKPKREVASK